jgi:hypothetical protein
MGSPGDGSLLSRAFYAVGYLLEEMEVAESSKQNAADLEDDDELGAIYDDEELDATAVDEDAEDVEDVRAPRRPRRRPAAELDEEEEEEDEEEGDTSVGAVIGASAGAWLIAKLLSPRPVSWPRALAAGLTGTALAEIVGTFERRLGAGKQPLEDLDAAEMLTRYVAGVGAAAVYGSLFYPRIPGTPLMRGLIFGAVEAAAAPAGGVIAFIRRIAPHQPGLLENLATSAVPGGTPATSLAYGLGLGLLYRPEDDDDDED